MAPLLSFSPISTPSRPAVTVSALARPAEPRGGPPRLERRETALRSAACACLAYALARAAIACFCNSSGLSRSAPSPVVRAAHCEGQWAKSKLQLPSTMIFVDGFTHRPWSCTHLPGSHRTRVRCLAGTRVPCRPRRASLCAGWHNSLRCVLLLLCRHAMQLR